jgi:hypothetical protein
LWPNIRFLPSIVAEKNATKNGHIQNVCSMCIKINKVGKQEVGIWWPPLPEGGVGYTVLPLSVLPSVQDSFRRIFLSNCWWQKSDIWSQASFPETSTTIIFLLTMYIYSWLSLSRIRWDHSVLFIIIDVCRPKRTTHWTYMHIFLYIFLSNYWWQRSDIRSQASYRYPISWEAFLDPSDSRFPQYGIPIWCLWPNIRFLPSTVTEKNVTKTILDGRKDGRTDRRTEVKHRGKRFWTHQIPTSCLLILLIFIHI